MHNETAPSTARFVPASSVPGQRSLGDTQPALNEINERVANLRETATHLAGRLRGTADRALGDVPSASGSTNGHAKAPTLGQTSAIFEGLSDLQDILQAALEQANRLERVA